MRFLHTADLHLGKVLNNISLLEDQAFALDQICAYAQSENVDGVLISGDVYQKSAPQAEAMTLFDSFVTRLSRMGKKVFIISGNHDSDRRISYFSSLLESSNVYVSPLFEGALTSIELSDEWGKLYVQLLPFVKPLGVKALFPNEKIGGYEDALKVIFAHSPIDTGARNVLLCHQLVTGAERSDSEDVTVGTVENVSPSLFDGFDYVALGHIHKPQRAGRETLRYAGSPLKYSFSEANHQKSVSLVDIGKKGDVKVTLLPLSPKHEMRLVRGTFEELLALPRSEDYVWATVTDENPVPDAKQLLYINVFPNLMRYTVENSRISQTRDVTAEDIGESESPVELFKEFYRFQRNNCEPTPEQIALIEKLWEEIKEEDK